MFLLNMLPSQHQNFISPRPRECEQANGSDYPRGAALVLFSLAQSIT